MNKVAFIIYGLITILFASACNRSKTLDWYPYYESQFTAPLGTYVFYEELEYQLPDAEIERIKNRTSVFLQDEYLEESTFMYINPTSYIDSGTLQNILSYLYRGNDLFFSSSDGDNLLYQYFGIQLYDAYSNTNELKFTGESKGQLIKSRIKYAHFFARIPERFEVLGTIVIEDKEFPNFIKLELSPTSSIYFHADPLYFSNYHMLHDRDGLYALNVLKRLNQLDWVLWDGYRTYARYTKEVSNGNESYLLSYVFKNPSLLKAFMVIISLIILFLAFNYKRVIAPLPFPELKENNTLAFNKMVSDLFRLEENLIDLGRYRTRYFLDRIRHKYYIDTSEIETTLIDQLSMKTGYSKETLKPLVNQLIFVKNRSYLYQKEFEELNNTLEQYINLFKLYNGRT